MKTIFENTKNIRSRTMHVTLPALILLALTDVAVADDWFLGFREDGSLLVIGIVAAAVILGFVLIYFFAPADKSKTKSAPAAIAKEPNADLALKSLIMFPGTLAELEQATGGSYAIIDIGMREKGVWVTHGTDKDPHAHWVVLGHLAVLHKEESQLLAKEMRSSGIDVDEFDERFEKELAAFFAAKVTKQLLRAGVVGMIHVHVEDGAASPYRYGVPVREALPPNVTELRV